MNVTLNAQGGQPSKLSYEEGFAKTQLVTEDGKRQVGVGKDVLSVHMLPPYQDPLFPEQSGWDEFLPRIEKALDAYWKVMQPKGVNRVGIRYINKIVIPQRAVRVEDFLKCALPEVRGLPELQTNFVSRVEYDYEDGVRLVLSQGGIVAPEAHVGFLLDLDVIWEATEGVARDEALAKVGDLRTREREAFEKVITDKARELFDAIETHSPVRSTVSVSVPEILPPMDPSNGSYSAPRWLPNGRESLATLSDIASLQKAMMELARNLYFERLTADPAGALWSTQLFPMLVDETCFVQTNPSSGENPAKVRLTAKLYSAFDTEPLEDGCIIRRGDH